jgi:diphosphomevalonate decarboxylase
VGTATAEAPPNIALIKYWGVRQATLGLPYNSSFSVTLERFRSRTRVTFGGPEDRFLLNRVPQTGKPREAVVELLDRIRSDAGRAEGATVTSTNNFPTASGLASSASGFAALALAGSAAAGLRWSPQRVSQLARFGSGSACRSLFGGFVEWQAGTRDDGRDCLARPRFGPEHWPGLVDFVTLLDDAPTKEVRSSVAMQRTVATAPGYAARVAEVPERLASMVRAIRRRDAPALFGLVIEECDSFRSVCEATDPPLDYLTRTSRRILEKVRGINDAAGEPVIGYTHDAGAHLHLFTLAEEVPALRRALRGVPGIRQVLVLRPGPGARLL